MASPVDNIASQTADRLQKSIEHFMAETRGIRSGTASPGLVDSIRVDYYGTRTPLNQLANISVPDPRSLMVKPFDASVLKEIERSILQSDIGINPSIEGKAIRLAIPPLSEEQRQKLVGRVKTLAEEAKISMRNVRRDMIKESEVLQKAGDLTEDDLSAVKKRIQDALKEYEGKIDSSFQAKSDEIMAV